MNPTQSLPFSDTLKPRLMASGIHLVGSLILISLYLSLVLLLWYPPPFDRIHSTSDVIWILIGVDVVLGPLFTLIVFDIRKRRKALIRDLSIVLFVQIAAFLYGLGVTVQMRPLFVVFQEETFYTVVKEDVDTSHLPESVGQRVWWKKPQFVYIEPLSDKEKVEAVMGFLWGTAPDIVFQVERYRPFSAAFRKEALGHAMPFDEVVNSEEKKRALQRIATKGSDRIDEYVFFPVVNSGFRATLVLRRSDFSVFGMLDL